MYGLPDTLRPLSAAEEQVMLAVWACPGAAARRDISQKLKATGWAAATVLNFLYRLEEKGYIARRRNPADGRYRIIEVTEKGNQVMEDMGEGARNLDERIYACMTDEEQAKLLELLDRILATMTENDGTEEQLEQHRERITQGGHTC